MDMSSSTTLFPIPSSSSSGQNQTPIKPFLNLDSLSVKTPSYTSLKDVLPYSAAAVNSPAANHHQVSIRNRLVKQAAWAYLQPMSTSPSGPSGPHLFRRNPVAACLSFIYQHILPSLTRTLHRILRVIPCFLPFLGLLRVLLCFMKDGWAWAWACVGGASGARSPCASFFCNV
ncbi:unnamed protein product [Sphenostylis stenocarpa]|uniref:Uncharacterized protein n=1 Tax=Sphenostylis stenocarpa TaxID=92480 RepID=A0AA86VI65_9FABA|nr:unnamed protein product [Sphenostylis stenocarpa]